jgi:hypothetical protein
MSSTDDNCCICREHLDFFKNIQLKCNHHFHSDCFIKYFEHSLNNNITSIKCPLCKDEILSINNVKIEKEAQDLLNKKSAIITSLIFFCTIEFFGIVSFFAMHLYY